MEEDIAKCPVQKGDSDMSNNLILIGKGILRPK
jgi:hypothetical protein